MSSVPRGIQPGVLRGEVCLPGQVWDAFLPWVCCCVHGFVAQHREQPSDCNGWVVMLEVP